MAQWLGHYASTAGDVDWFPGRGTKILHANWQKKKRKKKKKRKFIELNKNEHAAYQHEL